MVGAGFVNYGYEWWHYSYGDRYWAHAGANARPATAPCSARAGGRERRGTAVGPTDMCGHGRGRVCFADPISRHPKAAYASQGLWRGANPKSR
jgi:D-ala-D-ala dipeptidase